MLSEGPGSLSHTNELWAPGTVRKPVWLGYQSERGVVGNFVLVATQWEGENGQKVLKILAGTP